MSYFIKTPHTIFEVVGENDRVYFVKAKGNPNNTYSKSKCQAQVLAAADTIEELCDLFVVDVPNDRKFNREFDLDKCKEYQLYLKNQSIISEIYGAIWTDKGLIYVAKMNDKGELELL